MKHARSPRAPGLGATSGHPRRGRVEHAISGRAAEIVELPTSIASIAPSQASTMPRASACAWGGNQLERLLVKQSRLARAEARALRLPMDAIFTCTSGRQHSTQRARVSRRALRGSGGRIVPGRVRAPSRSFWSLDQRTASSTGPARPSAPAAAPASWRLRSFDHVSSARAFRSPQHRVVLVDRLGCVIAQRTK